MKKEPIKQFLPVSKAEMEERGWYYYDFLVVGADAYVDHPSFGTAIIARVLEAEGRLIIVASLAHAQTTLRKTQGVRPLARYDLTLSGQKSAVWVFCPQDESDSEA